jgi:hypothetical protein
MVNIRHWNGGGRRIIGVWGDACLLTTPAEMFLQKVHWPGMYALFESKVNDIIQRNAIKATFP